MGFVVLNQLFAFLLGFFVSTYVGLGEGSSVGFYMGGSSDGEGVGYSVGVGMIFLIPVTVGLG
mgnify:CR=1 FL=1